MRTLTQNEINQVGFRGDNTEGYSDAELDALNSELAEKLDGIEPFSGDWYQVAKMFTDEVSRL